MDDNVTLFHMNPVYVEMLHLIFYRCFTSLHEVPGGSIGCYIVAALIRLLRISHVIHQD